MNITASYLEMYEAITVDDSQWSYSNDGKKPKGDGNWAFDIDGKTVFIKGKYSQAKKNAMKSASAKNLYRIKLLP